MGHKKKESEQRSAFTSDLCAEIVCHAHALPTRPSDFTAENAWPSPAPESSFDSESFASVTQSLLARNQHVISTDFPFTDYIENVGVRPDTTLDYMTEDNLTNRGKAFVDGFVAAMLNLLQ